ncbi:ATP-dependent Clp protease ATP-binding subunit [Virgibacillus pantothenticus]|uniref:ATP-dependent Clp protease ATP-binding subunit n=1 Tax=Virgibacillus pantothenticus TaxID=1473 RepID=UPI001C235BAC|nr:ATP-dependent Clp protease ATP-binding subunit [Virgibacillus pantothenticus]MBU8567282.1 ATP-dependent Clp protease ATP-binding subunit [Virgibacillus pantothenticus]MBU8600037.1 ATP-dependent Clp protease ATP-binding subunit [Virgibacillus pantothenticus]MBU8635382.1 ATP-dependent Clp protease ATP-binding subunit [Virgibacillus pantothenticus]MBU8642333.1 ATP-dependent Clp protease ATP-binding subunit [Virgibacillus pantothenticus]MBU8646229.1 ATP-dependent Clp protease ATP-binding subuni
MLCQNCKQNEANINVAMQLNNQHMQMQLCNECFRKMQGQMMSGNDFFSQSPFTNAYGAFSASGNGSPKMGTRTKQHSRNQGNGLLDQLGKNLTDEARAGEIDPVIGRDNEVKRVIETLNRRNKNNPVLIGEPGVGKTAIAEGLALKIIEGDVPTKLLNKEIYMLDVASLVANTGVRGQFEERMKQLIQELQQRQDVILFVDEIHLLVGAGTAESSQMDAGNILKPALARGEIQLVGATTLKEYRQIEKDAALERRLQPIIVEEPTPEEAVQILKGIKDRYEKFHEVRYSDEAIEACVNLSKRYIQDRYLPDKAIDLMDEVGSRLNLANSSKDSESIRQRLEEITKEKEAAAEREDYERAAHLRYQEIQLQKQLEKAKGEEQVIDVDISDIQLIVEEKTGIPVTKLQADEQEKMKNLAKNLAAKVIGQKEAVDKVAKAIRRSRAGLKSKERPIGSFLFVGPTGVGKTELTKVLAEELFGSRDSLIRLDMSEYMEKHAVSKIIGSPPGYVGHEEAGQLTEKVRRNPYSIILLDEIEKAHPDVQNMFLQIMEDGHLTDSQGRTVSFKDTVIIMTSNAGTGDKAINVGFNKDGHESVSTLENLSDYFKPEFLNRFDAIIEFNELTKENLMEIVDLMLHELQDTIEEHEISITITDEAKQKLVELGYDPRFGARPLRRVIQDKIEDQLTDLVLENDDVKNVHVDVVNDEIVVKQA